ncbi:MAG: putative 2OG-Fe(II) oxygenase [Acidobacteriota bacterium]|jgi:hypothetical protein
MDQYERRLARYEAAERTCAEETLDDGSKVEFFSPFGPLISRVRAPQSLVDSINEYMDRHIEAAEPPGGAQTEDQRLGTFDLDESFLSAGGEASLASFTARAIARYLDYVDDRELKHVRFENFWMVRHFDGSFSPVHFHSGDVSGVLYLKMPDNIAREAEQLRRSYISARRAGYITFLIGGKQRFSKSLISFRPVVGDFYIFPGWLLHAVEPFNGVGERRSMSFNAFVE